MREFSSRMLPLQEFSAEQAAGVQYVLSDIDDTMTDEGLLPARSYDAMWRLHEAGFQVIPVTGRPAGWCDLIARQWPVAGVVGENGAFVFYMDGKHLKQIYHPQVNRERMQGELARIKERVFTEVPGTREAKDQFARMFDLAIDFCEEPPYLGLEEASKIKQICESFGAHAKVSSIHVNTWFGDYDKLSMTKLFFQQHFAIDLDQDNTIAVFSGDSPNDEPMFGYFRNSVAVANFASFADQVQSLPRYITNGERGYGFAELADLLCHARTGRKKNDPGY